MCCGAKRALLRNSTGPGAQAPTSPASARAVPAQTFVLFEYTGEKRLTVVSPLTGTRYHFDHPGAQVAVAPRDQSILIYVPDLRPVRFTQPS